VALPIDKAFHNFIFCLPVCRNIDSWTLGQHSAGGLAFFELSQSSSHGILWPAKNKVEGWLQDHYAVLRKHPKSNDLFVRSHNFPMMNRLCDAILATLLLSTCLQHKRMQRAELLMRDSEGT